MEKEQPCEPSGGCKNVTNYKAAFAVLFTIVGVVQGTLFTTFVGSITTLEKRYAFGSKVTGVINLADNISPILLSVVIAYFASRGHRIRWCGLCITLSGLSAIMFASPYFIFGSGRELMEGTSDLASSSSSNSTEMYQICGGVNLDCDTEEQSLKNSQTIPAVFILFVANFISGIGSCGYYIIGSPLVDDTVNNVHSPLYFAFIYSFRLAGPTTGFLISSAFLKYYEDPSDQPMYGSKDPRWIGAWWIPFILIGLTLTCLGLIMTLFPDNVIGIGSKVETEEKTSKNLKNKIKEMTAVTKMLVRNPILIFYNLAITCQLLGTIGYFVFLPKYLESEFQLSPSNSNKISGLAGMLVMVFGLFGSGIILYLFKPRPRYVMAWKVFAVGLSAVGLMVIAFIGCERTELIGTSTCSSTCGCDLHIYSPVCYKETNQTFFSPCHAGCSENSVMNGTLEVFNNCSCTAADGMEDDDLTQTVSMGVCETNCSNLLYFIIMLCIIKFFSSSGQIGSFLVMLRSVPPHEKTIALSLNSTFLCAFAMIPYPLIYGALVDSSCSIWETSCSGTGHCWVYDTEHFRLRLHLVTSGLLMASAVFNIFTCHFSNNVKNMYGEFDAKLEPNYTDNFVNETGTKKSCV